MKLSDFNICCSKEIYPSNQSAGTELLCGIQPYLQREFFDPNNFSGKIVCNNRIVLAILCKRPGVNEGELSADWETMLFSRWIFSGLYLLQISQKEIDLRIINSTRI